MNVNLEGALTLAVLAALLAAVLLLDWRRVRRWLAEERTAPATYAALSPGDAWPLTAEAKRLVREWEELGYRPVEDLRRAGSEPERLVVLLHPTLPAYAVVGWTARSRKQESSGTWTRLDTFYPDGGRLITTSILREEPWVVAELEEGSYLVEYRIDGRPLALDGQHVGTLRAWEAGGRVALPTTETGYAGYLKAHERRTAEQLAARGGLSFRAYLRCRLGRSGRLLRF